MVQMLTIEMYLIKELIMNWFGKKIKPNCVSIPLLQKINYEQNNPIRWSSDKCCLCNFKLDIMPTKPTTPDNQITYGDFYIRVEHKFLRNIYTTDELNDCDQIKTLEAYYETSIINICVCLQNVWEVRDFDEFSLLTKDFLREECDNNHTITDLRENIDDVE